MKLPITSIWITGLSSSGKTTLAIKLVQELRVHGVPCVLLDGNEVRDIFDKKLGYDERSRKLQTKRVQNLARWITRNKILPVVSIINPFEEDREEYRRERSGYFEIFLECDIKTLCTRDNKNLYAPALRGEKKNVVGIDIDFETPRTPDLSLNTAKLDANEAFDKAWVQIASRISENRI
ncbi:MAG: hypothetical protein CMM45_03500 [Rhodospirillaceae bacterium]|nr:hypothetical protein [Rhodospirillaceae bacterium]|tara:strand:- start:997 stop:1533 length:537 start_codon:yes stop_codon:yes gene_type:complete